MKTSAAFGILALAAVLLSPAAPAAADAVITLSNKRIEGTITSETDSTVVIRTEYGELTFQRLNLRQVIRGSGPATGNTTTSGGRHNPFYGDSGSAGSANPFGPSTGANPFTASGGGTGGASVAIDPATGLPAQAGAAPRREEFPAPGPRRVITPPDVPFSWDAVLFEIPEGGSVRVVPQPGAPVQTVSGQTNLRNGAVIETSEYPARIILKNGRDIVRVAPHTSIEMPASTLNRVVINLNRGSFWLQADEDSPGRQVGIHTTNSVISTTGGVLRVADALDRGIHVAVAEGRAEIISTKAQIRATLGAHETLLVRPSGVVTSNARITRIMEHEDSNWDTLEDNFWLRADRLGERRADEETNLISMNQLRSYVREASNAFIAFARDTGHIPTEQDAFTVLRENTGNWPGWKGPYWDGVLPPLDSWGRPMRYTTRPTGQGNNVVGIVYSIGEDYTDNGGDPSADIPEMILYYQLEGLAQGPTASPGGP